jgi:hypothetical protein
MRRSVAGAVVVLGLIWAAPAAAQDYGGGRLPASKAKDGFTPTVGIALQPRGDRLAFRFDTELKCGRTVYTVIGRSVVPFDGRSFSGSASRRLAIGRGRGNRILFSWVLRGAVDGTIGSGRLTIAGVRIVNGRRTSCTRKPRRRFSARVLGPAPTGSPQPPAKAAFGGLSEIRTADGLRAPVVLKVGSTGKRIRSRWNAFADCGRGPRTDLTNFTPPMRVRADGSFSRSERFSVSYADVFIRYRVRFTGRVSGELANGTLRLQARIYNYRGTKLRTRCDSGVRNWSAAMLRPIARTPQQRSASSPGPAPSPGATSTPTPTPEHRDPEPGPWSLNMTSEPGDYIGAGRTWSYGPPADTIDVTAYPNVISFLVKGDVEHSGPWWGADFYAPNGQVLAVGHYPDARSHPTLEGNPGFNISGDGRGCGGIRSSFTVHELVWDHDGTLRRFRADFEQRCENTEAALRGTWDFTASG